MNNGRDNKKNRQRIFIILAVIVVLLVIDLMLLVNRPDLFRAAPSNPKDIRYEALQRSKQQKSITYDVFKPAIDPYNNLVDFFRPSSLRSRYFSASALKIIGCNLLPSKPNRIPLKWLKNFGRGCY